MSFKASGSKTRPERVKPVPNHAPSTTDPVPSGVAHVNSSPSSRRSSTSTIESFHSAHNQPYFIEPDKTDESTSRRPEPDRIPRYSPAEEEQHVSESHAIKTQANTQFTKGDFSSALGIYDKAMAALPIYLHYEVAVLQSNIAACHIKLEEWKEAIKSAGRGLESLEKLNPEPDDSVGTVEGGKEDDEITELPDSNTADEDAELLRRLDLSDQRKADIHRIKTKLLLRRARARYMLGTTTTTTTTTAQSSSTDKNPFSQASSLETTSSSWSNLTSSLSDYTLLSDPTYMDTLPASDRKTVRNALITLPPLVEKAKEKEVGEMMGKLKELGNGILKPFGLSTDMFKVDKDPETGGMNLRFDGGGGGGGK